MSNPLTAFERPDAALGERLEMLALFRRHLRAERSRGLRDCWSYDLARHRQLLSAYRELVREILAEGESHEK
ncbi:MAG: hypothetical protein RIC14_04765 [Filomicrobium sp.]